MLRRLKRAGVWALALSMAVTMTPATAFATDVDGPEGADPAEVGQVVQTGDEDDPVVAAGEDEAELNVQNVDQYEKLSDCFETTEDRVLFDVCSTGLCRVYGEEDWDTGEKPMLALKSGSGLVEGVDFVREYAYFKGFLSFDFSLKNYFESDDETMFEFDEDPSGWDDAGYILEKITGLSEKYQEEVVYALHCTAIDVTIKVDDAYKVLSKEPLQPNPDPVFTATETVGKLPEDMQDSYASGTGYGAYVTIEREPASRLIAEKLPGPYALIPVISPESEEALCNLLSREVFSFELIDNGSTTVYVANGENPWFFDPDDFEGFDWDLSEMGEDEGSGADVNVAEGDDEDEEDYEFYDPPIKLNLLKGTLHVEEVNSLLPASEGRVAKQLEATNLTQGAEGKYTTTVKMTLPVTEGVDPEEYYLKHDLGKGEFDEENNYDDDYGDDDYDDHDVDYDWPSGADGSGGAAVAREDGRHRNPARMSKQNDTLYEETTVAFKLSPKFKLPLKKAEVEAEAEGEAEDGILDISKFKLVDYEYVYVPEGRKFEDTEYYEKNYEQFDEDYVKEVFNGQKPVRDEETGFICKDFKAYQVDPGEVVEELPEGTQVFGFGLIKRSDDEDDDDEVDANSEGREGEEGSGETYGMDDFLYLVFYLPEGMPDVVAESEPDDTEKTSAGEEEFNIFSYLDGPALIVQYFGDIKKDYTVNLLNPLHYFTFEFEEELADPSTTPGTYGTYDPLGDKEGAVDGATIKVLDGAVLVRDGLRQDIETEEPYPADPTLRSVISAASEDYGFGEERPEEFFIPTVSYTINGGGGNNNSTGGGGGRRTSAVSTVIPEPEVPLAETPELNKTDHVAYVIGYEDGTVRPENKITRAEVATIFFRLLTDESRKAIWSSSNSYKDTAAGAWYNNAVSTLSNGGVLSGYTDGTFLPSGNITRAEFATIAARFDESDVSTANISFTDIGGHWAEYNIKRAAALGYITGYQDGSFKPDDPITRAEAMTLLNRVLGRDKISASGLLDNMARWSDNPVGAWYYVAVQEATNTHDYTIEDGVETWTGILPNCDWAALEKAWASGAF